MSTRRDITDPTTPLLTEAAIDAFRADGSDAWVTIDGKSRRVSDLLRVLARRVQAMEAEHGVLKTRIRLQCAEARWLIARLLLVLLDYGAHEKRPGGAAIADANAWLAAQEATQSAAGGGS